MRNNRLLAVAGSGIMALGMMALVVCNAQAEKPGPAEPPKELTIDLGGGVKMEFVLIQPGAFTRGEGKDAHKVTLTKPFYLGKYEVTQEQWEKVMGSNPSHFKGAKNPVEMVSWKDCQSFLTKLNEKVSGPAFRLPTEAEWEYACRAGSTGDYCYGEGEGQLGDYAWFRGNSGGTTHPVGEKKANAWGLHDIHGNVWEWCSDWYGEEYPASAVTDPQGPASGTNKVNRGGGYSYLPSYVRCAVRNHYHPSSNSYNFYGFRVARSSDP